MNTTHTTPVKATRKRAQRLPNSNYGNELTPMEHAHAKDDTDWLTMQDEAEVEALVIQMSMRNSRIGRAPRLFAYD